MTFLLFMWAVLIALGMISFTSGAFIVATFCWVGSAVMLVLMFKFRTRR